MLCGWFFSGWKYRGMSLISLTLRSDRGTSGGVFLLIGHSVPILWKNLFRASRDEKGPLDSIRIRGLATLGGDGGMVKTSVNISFWYYLHLADFMLPITIVHIFTLRLFRGNIPHVLFCIVPSARCASHMLTCCNQWIARVQSKMQEILRGDDLHLHVLFLCVLCACETKHSQSILGFVPLGSVGEVLRKLTRKGLPLPKINTQRANTVNPWLIEPLQSLHTRTDNYSWPKT